MNTGAMMLMSGQMRAAAVVRVVGDEHVAGADLAIAKALQDLVDRADHRAQVNRHALRQRDHLPCASKTAVEQSARSLMFGENAVRIASRPSLRPSRAR